MASAIPTTFVLYSLYWYAGTCYGARFYHVALPVLLVLAALGLDQIAVWKRPALGIVLVSILLWNGVIGLRGASEIAGSYWGTDARFARLATTWKDDRALVLVAFAPEDLHFQHEVTTFMKDVTWLKNIRALGGACRQ